MSRTFTLLILLCYTIYSRTANCYIHAVYTVQTSPGTMTLRLRPPRSVGHLPITLTLTRIAWNTRSAQIMLLQRPWCSASLATSLHADLISTRPTLLLSSTSSAPHVVRTSQQYLRSDRSPALVTSGDALLLN
ncbi:hypothetical protein BDY19DRAFT_972241 [Irpex rosettiformis]|uniref:Uncharacterized protein n=1 Tax=Irpex rosettiformis TaxID=378272 RepID=A0ACB8TQV3_9APHY|nr:hypothetical protein BDY19DRAFT_972241 [Irpex rosettiformis]